MFHTSLFSVDAVPARNVAEETLLRQLGLSALPSHRMQLISVSTLHISGASLLQKPPRLAESIRRFGILQAPLVVPLPSSLPEEREDYEVIAGRRRVLVAREIGLEVIACTVYSTSTPQLSAILALLENVQRSPAWIKEVQDLHQLVSAQVGMTLDELVACGFPRTQLVTSLKMARLPDPILSQMFAGKISQGVARKLIRLSESQQQVIARYAQAGEQITAELVSSVLKKQINAGLALLHPLLTVKKEAPASAPVAEKQQVPSERPGVLPASEAAPSLPRMIALLEAFGRSAPGQDSRVHLLLTALVQQLHQLQRTISQEEIQEIHP